jgi:hypothetical protein
MEPGQTNRYFSALSFHPSISFETQRQGEEVLLMLRAHPITQIPWILNSILLFLILIVINVFFLPVFAVNQAIVLNAFSVVFILSYIWFNILNWFFNVGIITSERIVDVDFSNILYKELNVARLESIEDLTSKSAGYFGSLFNYGEIHVQTAGSQVNIEFPNTPDPSAVVHIINEVLQKKHGSQPNQ